MKTAALVLIAGLIIFFYWETAWHMVTSKETNKHVQLPDNKGKKRKKKATFSAQIQIINSWDMPAVLREISGIAYLSTDRFACIQDELGTIFIYDTNTNSIIQEIPFAEAGDYEGITLVGKTAYIVRSDGRLYEVENITGTRPKVKVTHFNNFLSAEQDVEGLCYDAVNNRLLLSIKGTDPQSQDYKGIYAFDMVTKKLLSQPVYKIDVHDTQLAAIHSSKSKKSVLQPSDIEIHPQTGDIYLTEAVHHQIIVLDTQGTVKTVYQLDKSLFAKPEGITFSSKGDLFISNEGKKGQGNILQINLDSL